MPLLVPILAAQMLWGIGYTFTSGANQAWITDEIGENQVAPVFAREQQIHLGAGLVGTLVAGLLSLAAGGADGDLRAGVPGPRHLAAAGHARAELHPDPADRRRRSAHGDHLLRRLRLAAARPVVRACCWSPSLPGWPARRSTGFGWSASWGLRRRYFLGADNVGLWFAGFSPGSAAGWRWSLFWLNRRGGGRDHDPVIPGGVLAALAAPAMLCVLAVALGGSLGLVLAGAGQARRTPWPPVEATWLNSEPCRRSVPLCCR